MKFFARFVILIEGEIEELALPEYFAVVGLDCDQKGCQQLQCWGKLSPQGLAFVMIIQDGHEA